FFAHTGLLLTISQSESMKHSLKYFITASSGHPNISEFQGVGLVDGVEAGHCDSSNRILELRQDWAKKILEKDPRQLHHYSYVCFENLPDFFRGEISRLKQEFDQSGGVHILQRIDGCEWDDNTGEVTGLERYGYNGEDFIELDLKTLTWIALKPEAAATKLRWDAEININTTVDFFTKVCPLWLSTVWDIARGSLQRTVLPSVSLLQKSPSSPISCHATGFYPDRAVMFWRKDGEEIHEGVDHGEILPNADETFQMSIDLSVSSVKPEDWSRYECVFQLSGVEDSIVTRLNETRICSDWVGPFVLLPSWSSCGQGYGLFSKSSSSSSSSSANLSHTHSSSSASLCVSVRCRCTCATCTLN
uniref:Ig-like domain-containing protein n=1 Tax=Amphilophus citrinellus TaxID=61819 RepID=A0A3Q0QQZ9_AMPCI